MKETEQVNISFRVNSLNAFQDEYAYLLSVPCQSASALMFSHECFIQSDGDANDSDAMTTTANVVSLNGNPKNTETA